MKRFIAVLVVALTFSGCAGVPEQYRTPALDDSMSQMRAAPNLYKAMWR